MATRKRSTRTTCIREGCRNKLPELAIAHSDPYCSTACARMHLDTDEKRKKLT